MVPLYAARIEHLGPADFVRAECLTCGHDELIPTNALVQGLRLAPTTLMLDLAPRLRRRECSRARSPDKGPTRPASSGGWQGGWIAHPS